jgi:TPR repeat protein
MTAISAFNEAVQQSCIPSCTMLGHICEHGAEGVEASLTKAI